MRTRHFADVAPQVVDGRLFAATSVLVIEEVWHLEHRGRPPLPAGTAALAAELFPVLLSVTPQHLRAALASTAPAGCGATASGAGRRHRQPRTVHLPAAPRQEDHQPPGECHTADRFHGDIRRLLAHRALRGVVVPSRAEPFGRVPIEAYAAGATPVIATTAGGLAEQVIDGRTGFTAAPEDPASLSAVLRRALALAPAERHRIREEAQRFAASRYDHPRAVRSFLKQVAPWLDRKPGDSQST